MINNRFHLSNLIGIKYETLLDILGNTCSHYGTFSMIQKNKKKRIINSPTFELRIIQDYILEYILPRVKPHKKSCAFESGKSILTHAKFHQNSDWSINLDIKDFFPSISYWFIYRVFLNEYNFNEAISQVLADLSCYKKTLPQGSPTSPYLSNIILKPLDIYFDDFFMSEGLIYSRYGDDITISGKFTDSKQKNYKWGYVNIVQKKLEEVSLDLNYSKIRYYENSLKITGLVIRNQSIFVPQKYIRSVSQELFYIRKFSLSKHLINRFDFDKQSQVYLSELKGRLLWIRQVNVKQYSNLLFKYNETIEEILTCRG